MDDEPETVDGAGDGQVSENPFVCNICKKSYSRIDHLARHYRSRELALSPKLPTSIFR